MWLPENKSSGLVHDVPRDCAGDMATGRGRAVALGGEADDGF